MKGENLKVRARKLLKAVRPEAQIMKEPHADGREVHFGALMELCSIKPARERILDLRRPHRVRGDIDEARAVRSQYLQSEATRHLIWRQHSRTCVQAACHSSEENV